MPRLNMIWWSRIGFCCVIIRRIKCWWRKRNLAFTKRWSTWTNRCNRCIFCFEKIRWNIGITKWNFVFRFSFAVNFWCVYINIKFIGINQNTITWSATLKIEFNQIARFNFVCLWSLIMLYLQSDSALSDLCIEIKFLTWKA